MAENNNEKKTGSYFIVVFILLCVATFFEGYDFFIVSLIQKNLAGDFGVKVETVIYSLAIINIGAILGFFVIRLGDRIGRKPILIIGVACYAGLSLLTGFMPGLTLFEHFISILPQSILKHINGIPPALIYYTAVQFLTKMFLVTEFGMAIIIITEEAPVKYRATSVAAIELFGGFGGIAATLLSKSVIPSMGWRGMYYIGGLPLLVVPILIFALKETGHFRAMKNSLSEKKASLWHIWTTPARKYVLVVGSLWFLCYLSYAGVIYHWVTFAKVERGWDEAMVSTPMAIGALVGMSGYVVSGIMMDFIGRKITAMIFFLGGAVSLVAAFQVPEPIMMPALVASMFFVFAIIPICSTLNSELFPTEIRSDASAWCNFLLGRPAQSVAPFIVANIAGIVGGIGNAVSMLAIGPVLAIFVVLFFVPETRGLRLSEVKE